MENLVKSIKLKIWQKRYLLKMKKFCRHKYPIIINSIPKCGTNLILNIINQIPNTNYTGDFSMAALYSDPVKRFEFIKSNIKKLKPGDVYSGHVPYSENFDRWIKKNKVKLIFIYRNPRDYTVSLYHYIMKDKKKKHAHYDLYQSFGSDNERLKMTITGYGPGKDEYVISENSVASAEVVFNEYAGWLDYVNLLKLTYKDIVDLKDNDDKILDFYNKLLNFLEIDHNLTSEEKIEFFKKGIEPQNSHTFRKGITGIWKEEYTQEHIKLFKSHFSDDLLKKYSFSYND